MYNQRSLQLWYVTLYGHFCGLLHYLETSIICYIIWTLLWSVTLFGHFCGMLHCLDISMVCYIIWTLLWYFKWYVTLFGHFYCMLNGMLHYLDTSMVCYIVWTLLWYVTLFGHFYGLFHYMQIIWTLVYIKWNLVANEIWWNILGWGEDWCIQRRRGMQAKGKRLYYFLAVL